jgi:putative transposase
MQLAQELSTAVGKVQACEALRLPRSSFYRSTASNLVDDTRVDRRSSPRALSDTERKSVLRTLHSNRFVDKSPGEVYATLLDEGEYLCSERTMYRILETENEVRERRHQLRHPRYEKPELLATGPNQVWSWDITKLRGPKKWTYFYLYVILDIYSRYVVGWMVAERESASLAKRLIEETYHSQDVTKDQLVVHADRGPSMKSMLVAQLFADLGVTKSHSRPYVSDDNPYSEAQFKTLKYHPLFPGRFSTLKDSRTFLCPFFRWYNEDHRHSGIGQMTPAAVHSGRAQKIHEQRSRVLLEAHRSHPERFVNRVPSPPRIPRAAWINRPSHLAPDSADVQFGRSYEDAFHRTGKGKPTEQAVVTTQAALA